MSRPDFPKSLPEFNRRFSTEEACFDYLLASRWPEEKFRCPGCGHPDAYKRGDRLAVQCAKCAKITTATAGTVMAGTRQPLCSWLLAAFLMVIDKRGISAVQLQRSLGLKRHETAFQMLHKLRAAMVAPERTLLHGVVEVDEAFVGGRHSELQGYQRKAAKSIVAGAVEVRDKAPARIRFRVVPDITALELQKFIHDTVEEGSTVVTDGSPSYKTLKGYRHEVVVSGKGYDQDDVLPHFHMAVSNLKAWIQGTFHGAVRREHLQAYLNEFAFRYNRRNNLHAAFQTLLGLAPKVEGPTYGGIYSGEFHHVNPTRRKRA